jgi:flagellar M-ring protein FliF
VVNTPFAGADKEEIVELPVWKKPETIQMAKEVGKYLLAAIVLLYLFFSVLKPMLRKLSTIAPPAPMHDDNGLLLEEREAMPQITRGYQENLEAAKLLARQDPKMVANVVKTWVSGNE